MFKQVKNKKFQMNDRVVSPVLELIEEPVAKVRFAHQCESINELTKNFHLISLTAKLNNIDLNLIPNLKIYVVVSLVLDNPPHSPHPYTLQSTDRKLRTKSYLLQRINSTFSNSFFFELDKNTSKVQVENLFIQTAPFEQIESFFAKKALELFNETFDSHIETFLIDNINQNFELAKLKLQVVIHDVVTQKINYLTEPILSNMIQNSLNTPKISPTIESVVKNNELKIYRTSRITGSIKGNDEMFLFCSRIDPNDIEVEFFQLKKEIEVSWREYAELDRTDIHRNCAMVIRTPKFTQLEEKKLEDIKTIKTRTISKVYFRLYRPSTNEYSEKWAFYYSPDENYEFRYLFGDLVDENFLRRYSDKFGLEVYGKTLNNNKKRKKKEKNETKDDDMELESLLESSNSSHNDEDEDKECQKDDEQQENQNDENKAKKIKLEDNSKAHSSK